PSHRRSAPGFSAYPPPSPAPAAGCAAPPPGARGHPAPRGRPPSPHPPPSGRPGARSAPGARGAPPLASRSRRRARRRRCRACPTCGRPPAELVVCVHEEEELGHCACNTCATRCPVCASDFCADHGIAHCRVDEQPACEQHARECPSCCMVHCTAHEGTCAEGDHPACSACLEACGSCGRTVCNRHAEQSRADAPKGSRRLCATCLRHCEGGTNEPVGVD